MHTLALFGAFLYAQGMGLEIPVPGVTPGNCYTAGCYSYMISQDLDTINSLNYPFLVITTDAGISSLSGDLVLAPLTGIVDVVASDGGLGCINLDGGLVCGPSAATNPLCFTGSIYDGGACFTGDGGSINVNGPGPFVLNLNMLCTDGACLDFIQDDNNADILIYTNFDGNLAKWAVEIDNGGNIEFGPSPASTSKLIDSSTGSEMILGHGNNIASWDNPNGGYGSRFNYIWSGGNSNTLLMETNGLGSLQAQYMGPLPQASLATCHSSFTGSNIGPGTIGYDGGSNLYLCNGSAWVPVASAGGSAGSIQYNSGGLLTGDSILTVTPNNGGDTVLITDGGLEVGGCTASGRNSLCVGDAGTASGFNSTETGMGNTASGNFSAAVGGNNNTVSGQFGFCGGGQSNNDNGHSGCIMGGTGNNCTGDWGACFGQGNTCGNGTIAAGLNNNCNTAAAACYGQNEFTSTNNNEFLAGRNNSASADSAWDIGVHNQSSSEASGAVGEWANSFWESAFCHASGALNTDGGLGTLVGYPETCKVEMSAQTDGGAFAFPLFFGMGNNQVLTVGSLEGDGGTALTTDLLCTASDTTAPNVMSYRQTFAAYANASPPVISGSSASVTAGSSIGTFAVTASTSPSDNLQVTFTPASGGVHYNATCYVTVQTLPMWQP